MLPHVLSALWTPLLIHVPLPAPLLGAILTGSVATAGSFWLAEHLQPDEAHHGRLALICLGIGLIAALIGFRYVMTMGR